MNTFERDSKQNRIIKCFNPQGELVLTNQKFIEENVRSFMIGQSPPYYSMSIDVNNHRETWTLDRKDLDHLHRVCKQNSRQRQNYV